MNILNLYKNDNIDQNEMLILYVVLENDNCDLKNLSKIINNPDKLREILERLHSKKLINIDWNSNQVSIKKEESSASRELNAEFIDKIRVIINREINYYELELLKGWYKNYDDEQILEAIYKAVLKDIDNFKYIDKILKNNIDDNNYDGPDKNPPKLKKNFDFFS